MKSLSKLNLGKYLFFLITSVLSISTSFAQEDKIMDYSKWTILSPGLEYIEELAPLKSKIGDSKLSILRIEPSRFQVDIHSATNYDCVARNLYEWADSFKLNIVFNAGMYDLRKPLYSRGYLRSRDHLNNSNIIEGFNSMIAIGPKKPHLKEICILDLRCSAWEEKKDEFHSFAQGIRMLDCNGNPMAWNKVQSCSMLVAAEDPKGFFYLIFCRSPYTQNEMIQFLLKMPYKLRNAIYLEGGPETSLLIDVNGHCIEKVGSWVAKTWEKDTNYNFWKLPNVIGIKQR